MVFGLGGSSSKQRSSSQSTSESYGIDQSQTYLSPEQLAMQQQLYGQFTPALGYSQGNMARGFQGMEQSQNRLGNMSAGMQARGVNNLLRGNKANQQLGGVANLARQGQYMGQHQGQQGMQALGQFSNQANPYLNQQIAGLAQDFGQMYQEQILPGIQNQFSGGGQRGSSRQGIAEALGGQRVMQEFGQAATGLRSQAYGMQQQAATDRAALGNQAGLGYGQLRADAYGNQAQLGYGTGTNLLAQAGQYQGMAGNLAGQQMGYGLQPFQIGAGIAGNPSVLSQSLGIDYSTAQSTSKGKGSSSSLNLGFG